MKNNKSFKTILNCSLFIAIFIALIMLLIHVFGSNWNAESATGAWSYFYSIEGNRIMIDWMYATPYLVFVLIAFAAWLVQLILYSIPSYKRGGTYLAPRILCKSLIGVGLILAIIALFLPIGLSYDAIVQEPQPGNWSGATILGWIGIPLAFAGSLATLGMAFKKALASKPKKEV